MLPKVSSQILRGLDLFMSKSQESSKATQNSQYDNTFISIIREPDIYQNNRQNFMVQKFVLHFQISRELLQHHVVYKQQNKRLVLIYNATQKIKHK